MTKEYFIILKGKDKSAEIEYYCLENENLKVVFKKQSANFHLPKRKFCACKKIK